MLTWVGGSREIYWFIEMTVLACLRVDILQHSKRILRVPFLVLWLNSVLFLDTRLTSILPESIGVMGVVRVILHQAGHDICEALLANLPRMSDVSVWLLPPRQILYIMFIL